MRQKLKGTQYSAYLCHSVVIGKQYVHTLSPEPNRKLTLQNLISSSLVHMPPNLPILSYVSGRRRSYKVYDKTAPSHNRSKVIEMPKKCQIKSVKFNSSQIQR